MHCSDELATGSYFYSHTGASTSLCAPLDKSASCFGGGSLERTVQALPDLGLPNLGPRYSYTSFLSRLPGRALAAACTTGSSHDKLQVTVVLLGSVCSLSGV